MYSKKSLIFQADELSDIKAFVEVYEEIAATRMQKIRKDVLQARDFLSGILEIFADVKFNYKAKVGEIVAKSRLNRNGRTVAVFLSSNAGLYGDIVSRTFAEFTKFLDANGKADAVVVGKQGLRLMSEKRPQTLYNYFDFSDEKVEGESLGVIMRYLLQFEKIIVFYGQFKNIVEQNPQQTSISGDELIDASQGAEKRKQYLFEPNLVDMLQVFEGEILSSLFEQVMHEANLAKFASRLTHLDRAIENINQEIAHVTFSTRVLNHKIDNKRQLARISGISLWAK